MLEILGETLEEGAVLAGAYRLERVLGQGGMGVVWAAQELATKRAVALKFLREGRETDPKNQERFLREARAAMAVVHPSIARVEAVLETEAGVPFMVMELLVGESLRALLERRGLVQPAECARLLLPVVDAVMAAHAGGVVHRDLKPENVFIVGPNDVRVLDFGIAKLVTVDGEPLPASLTSTGALLGTPLYMAPEQIFGDQDVDARADVWSLGIVIYECLAARRPTDGDGFGPIIKRITTDTLVPLERARSGLPGRITRLVGRMLSRDKALRPALSEVRETLAAIAAGGDAALPSQRDPLANMPTLTASTTAGIAGHRVLSEPPAQSARPARRWPLGVAAAAVAVALGGGWLAMNRSHASTPPGAASPPLPVSPSASASTPLLAAAAAMQARDGAACLRDLDAYDAQVTRPDLSSKNPAFGSALTRASCMMLSGDCDGGKALYAKAFPILAAGSNPTPNAVETAADSVAAQYCEGSKLAPRDELLRANLRLVTAGAGMRTVTPAECREWHATEVRLGATVKPRSPDDLTIASLPLGIADRAVRCFARAADCGEAQRIARADWTQKNPQSPGEDPKAYEQRFRGIYDAQTTATPCAGKP